MSIFVGIILIVFVCVLAGISIIGWMYESHKNEVLGSKSITMASTIASMIKTISEQEQKIKKLESWVKILETNAKEEVEVDLNV